MSSKFNKVGDNLSIAFLKHGWVDSGWLVDTFVSRVGTDSNDFIVLFPTVLIVLDSTYLFDFLANFFNKGFDCCCYSVKIGFWARIFFWVSSSSSKIAMNSIPLCCTSGSQC